MAGLESILGVPLRERRSPQGAISVWAPGGATLGVRLSGVLDREMAAVIAYVSHEHLSRSGRIHGFHDWRGLVDYEAEARGILMALTLEMAKRTEVVHLLAPERRVSMALRAAAAVFPFFRLHETEHALLHELRAHLRSARGSP